MGPRERELTPRRLKLVFPRRLLAQNALALKRMRELLPEDLVSATRMSRNKIVERFGVTRALADRFWRKKVLWLIWMSTEDIAKLHAHELETRFWYWGLDIQEQRAVFAVLPVEFENDFDGKKKLWRAIFKDKLMELVRGQSFASSYNASRTWSASGFANFARF